MDIHRDTLGSPRGATRGGIRWWQSIRWRLALGSVLVTLLATALLALTALVVIVRYYENDQVLRITDLAASRAPQIGIEYARREQQIATPLANLRKAAATVLAPAVSLRSIQDRQYLMAVINGNRIIYPQVSNQAAAALVRLIDPHQQRGDSARLRAAILAAFQGNAVSDEIGSTWLPQPFTVQPIFDNGQKNGAVIGVLFVAPLSALERTPPPYVATVGGIVLLASLVVAVVAALAAILFSGTITRPLAKLTSAARKMASGDYSTRVHTGAQGELGELASTFNEMAAQLHRDVEELHKQEAWRHELIMSITHDLATPLTAIAGLGESLVDGVNQSREDYEATGRIIVRETLRLRRLVKDLHMMAKVEAGALHPQRKNIRLAALADEVLAVLTPEFERLHVEPRNAIPYQLPSIQADPDMLTRVLSNLCDNALHHTPPGGSVTIEATQQGNALIASVTDTGQGIPPAALSRVFERFFRVDSSRQSTTGGSGLGLAIVRAIIEAHGGKVWAENAPGAGARITFTLPLQPAGQLSLSDAPTRPLLQKDLRDTHLVKNRKVHS